LRRRENVESSFYSPILTAPIRRKKKDGIKIKKKADKDKTI